MERRGEEAEGGWGGVHERRQGKEIQKLAAVWVAPRRGVRERKRPHSRLHRDDRHCEQGERERLHERRS
eukprot:2131383-Pleurochrysis_carterae.AAC.1